MRASSQNSSHFPHTYVGFKQTKGENQTNNSKQNSSRQLNNTQVSEQNTLQLMVRAHQRIRTLEQDNQILRMHVELLSKDNKELNQKLEKALKKINESYNQSQELHKKIQQYQIKIQGYKVKQQLKLLQNQKIHKISKQDQCQQKLQYQMTILKNTELLSTYDKKQAPEIFSSKLFSDKEKAFPQQIEKNKITRNLQNMNEKKPFKDQTNEKINQNLSNIYDAQKVQQLQNYKRNKSQSKQGKNYYLLTQSKYFSRQRNQNKITRNLSQKDFSHNQYTDNRLNPKLQRNLSVIDPIQNNTQEYRPSKSFQATGLDFQSTKNSQFRSSSPLIRKNYVDKGGNGHCQFHSHKRASSNNNYGYNAYSNEANLSKKFNYSNWRRTNNNFQVWRAPPASGYKKQILIER